MKMPALGEIKHRLHRQKNLERKKRKKAIGDICVSQI